MYYKNRTLTYKDIFVLGGFTVVGPKEGEGHLNGCFDKVLEDDRFNQTTFEKAERAMFCYAVNGAISKCNLMENDIDVIIGGDLLNQSVSTSFMARQFHVGFLGLYNACATFVESIIVGVSMLNNGLDNVACVSGSHFSTAERQYRFPLELGVLRPPVSQWTATGVGASIITNNVTTRCPRVNRATIGRVIDFGVLDINNMGAAMAPAAVDTLLTFINDTGAKISDYDLIATGDLGKLGHEIFVDLLNRQGVDVSSNSMDCGATLFKDNQKTHQGGSGAGCCAIVFNSYIMHLINTKVVRKALIIATGALMSPTTSFQGDSIPCIAHLIEVVGD